MSLRHKTASSVALLLGACATLPAPSTWSQPPSEVEVGGRRCRSEESFAYCDESFAKGYSFEKPGATRFVVADFRPGCELPEDIRIGRTAANRVERLLRDYLVSVVEGEAAKKELARRV